jgi:Ca-activated chloride channel family protein
MLRFGHSEYLWALWAVPAFLVLFIWVAAWKRRALKTLGDREIVNRMMPQVSLAVPRLKFILFSLAFAFVVLGAADPQLGSKIEEEKRSGADLMICLDVSNSMLARDIAPSRLENAKRALSQLIENLHNDRIGIIVFAGEAYVQLPMTTDYGAAKLFLNTISTEMVPTQGTAIGDAIQLGMKSFDFKDGTGKAIIIITDGENHEDDAVAAAKDAASANVSVHVIGIGSPEGAPIPVMQGGKQVGFHTDSAGQNVVSKLDESMGKEIAAAGKGAYVRATNSNSGLNIVMDQINKIQRKTLDTKNFKDYEDRFQIFLALALVLLIIDFLITNRRSERLGRVKLFEVKKT